MEKHYALSVADLGGVRGVLVVYFCVHNCTSPSNDYACSSGMQQQQPGTVSYTLTYQFLTDLQTFD